jgi:hypothetical protein
MVEEMTTKDSYVRRIFFLGLLSVLVAVVALGLDSLNAKNAKYIEVHIDLAPSRNETVVGLLQEAVELSTRIDEAIKRETGSPIDMDVIVPLIDQAEESTDLTFKKLRDEIIFHYRAIVSMLLRLNKGWEDPSKLRYEWFEKPEEMETVADLAMMLNLSEACLETVDLELGANRTIAFATYTAIWETSFGSTLSNRTEVLVRIGTEWKFRRVDRHLER